MKMSFRASVVSVLALVSTASAAEPTILLGGRQPWRKHYTLFPPRITVEAAKAEELPTDAATRAKAIEHTMLTGLTSPPPPGDWMQPDFDDAGWYLAPARDFSTGDGRIRSGNATYVRATDSFIPEIGLICARGRFVADPKRVKALKLSVRYRGGFVAYLNGKEVARVHLPDGELTFDTAAEAYGLDAFWVTNDKGKREGLNWYKHRHDKYMSHWAKRERSVTESIDPKLLREGVNVLAVAMHRSEWPDDMGRKKKRRRYKLNAFGFAPVGLATLSFTAEGAEAPKVDPVRLQSRPTWQQVLTAETENPVEPTHSIRIAAARNGRFSGQLVVRGDEAVKGLSARVSALKAADGDGAVSGDAVTVRYAVVNPVQQGKAVDYAWRVKVNAKRLDALVAEPPAEAPVVAVWVTVRVPRDVPAGDYRGKLTVRAEGLDPTDVPIELSVADWTLPDVKDYGGVFLAYQSPDTLAKHYEVPLWSDRHWKLVEQSLKLLGEAGNAGLVFPLLAESCKGNAESMVYWIRKGKGAWDFDYSLLDRYLATALKYHDPKRIKVACLLSYGSQLYLSREGKKELWSAEPKVRDEAAHGAKVTVVDPDSGKKETVRLRDFGLPEGIAGWKKLLPAACERLEEKGLGHATMIGMSEDKAPMPQYLAAVHDILPDMVWFRDSHFDVKRLRFSADRAQATIPVGCNAIVWAGLVPDPDEKRNYGWQANTKHLVLSFNRPGVSHLHLHNLDGFPRPWSMRMWMEVTLAYGRNGVGRVGADYFRIVGRHGTLYNSYQGAYSRGATNLTHTMTDLLAPGPDGPVATVRFENAREGFQESEARIFIEKALVAGRLDEDLARRCQGLLDERTNMLRVWPRNDGRQPIGAVGWGDKTQRLFELAGEVARAGK